MCWVIHKQETGRSILICSGTGRPTILCCNQYKIGASWSTTQCKRHTSHSYRATQISQWNCWNKSKWSHVMSGWGFGLWCHGYPNTITKPNLPIVPSLSHLKIHPCIYPAEYQTSKHRSAALWTISSFQYRVLFSIAKQELLTFQYARIYVK